MRTLFFNGKIYADAFAVPADALLCEDGRVIALGNAAALPAADNRVDLQGRTVIPALADVHTHASWIAETVGAVACVSPIVNTIPEMIEALKKHPAAQEGPDVWITGWGYDESKLAEKRAPTRHDLDKADSVHPIFIRRSDCHSAVCNTRALELAGITANTPDPAHGRFERDPDGSPNGVLTEFEAAQRVQAVMTRPSFENAVETMRAASDHFLTRGIVAVTEMMASREQLSVAREAARRGFVPRTALYLVWTGEDDPCGMPDLTEEEKTGDQFIAGIKLFGDGGVSGMTAWMKTPFTNGSTGISALPESRLAAAETYCRRNGVQLSVHAMGELAIEQVVARFEHKTPWLADRPSVRIEHATFLDASQIARMKASPMQFGVTTQPIFAYAEIEGYLAALTPDAFARIYPLRTFTEGLDALALTSDAPATAWADPDNPFTAMYAAVTRRAWDGTDFGQAEAIDRRTALSLYTARAMKVVPLEGLGSLHPGARCDFAVLSDDFFAVPEEKLGGIHVVSTYVGGNQVF